LRDPIQGNFAGNRKSSAASLAMGGMFAALVFAATAFLHLPMNSGYIHLGDGFILLGASLLGFVAVPAAAVGSLLADLQLNFAAYALPSFLIKSAMAAIAVIATRRSHLWPRLILLSMAEMLMIAGYFAVEWLFMGYGFAGAWANVPGNMIQGVSGVVLFFLVSPVLRRVRL